MGGGLIVLLEGPQADEVAEILASRLRELGRKVEPRDARDGAIVITSDAGLKPEGVPRLLCPLSKHDTPDFATEKILDRLAEAGAVALGGTGYSREEEERIRERLANLGYIE